jgi:TPR repeat protein
MYGLGCLHNHGGDRSNALEYFFRSAELGHAQASHALAGAYLRGDGMAKDNKKVGYYSELAAMKGHNISRHDLDLDVFEYKAGRYDKALKHWLIACECGHRHSLKAVRYLFVKKGLATKKTTIRLFDHTNNTLMKSKAFRGMRLQLQRMMKITDIYKYLCRRVSIEE